MSGLEPPERRDVMRASDADRERIVEVLRTAMAEGRLTQAELMQRTDTAYAARTYADLDAIIVDLPPRTGASPRRVPAVPTAAAVPARADRGLAASWWAWAAAVSINVVIWFLVDVSSAEDVYFWPIWVAGPWGAVLVVATIRRAIEHRGR